MIETAKRFDAFTKGEAGRSRFALIGPSGLLTLEECGSFLGCRRIILIRS
jgi:hypothetical protein